MRLLSTGLCALTLSVCFHAYAEAEPRKQLDLVAQKSVFPIRVACEGNQRELGVLGSAFAVNSTYMVTALHNFTDKEKLKCSDDRKVIYVYKSASDFNTAERTKKITGDDRFSYKYRSKLINIERASEGSLVDAVLFSVNADGELLSDFLCKSTSRVRTGMDIYLGAYHKIDENLKYTFRTGKIDRPNGALGDRNPSYSTTQLGFFPGNSGAPVLDSAGCVVGVVSGRTGNDLAQMGQADYNHIVPLSLMSNFNKYWGIPSNSRYSIAAYLTLERYTPIAGREGRAESRFKHLANFSPDFKFSDVKKFVLGLEKLIANQLGIGGHERIRLTIRNNRLLSDSDTKFTISNWSSFTARQAPILRSKFGGSIREINLDSIFSSTDSSQQVTLSTGISSVYIYKLPNGGFSFSPKQQETTHIMEATQGSIPLVHLGDLKVTGRFREYHDGLEVQIREELIKEFDGKLAVTELSLEEINRRNERIQSMQPSVLKLETLRDSIGGRGVLINYILKVSVVINER